MSGQPSPRETTSRKAQGLLALLAILAAISLGRGIYNALAVHGTQDFQWSPTHLLLAHIDPWRNFLLGDPAHGLVLTQFPNYLPLLYVMLIPLGLFPFAVAKVMWMLLNLFFAAGATLFCGRYFGLSRYRTAVLLLLLFMSTPMRNSLALGQQSIFVVFLWATSLCAAHLQARPWILGLSYFKYSFAPPAFVFLLLEQGWLAALVSIVPAVATLLAVYVWLAHAPNHVGFLTLLMEPLRVATHGYFGLPGPNLMELIQDILEGRSLSPATLTIMVYVVPTLLACIFIWAIRNADRHAQVALLALISLAIFKHHPYDAVILLFPVAYALRHLQLPQARWILALLSVFWYLDRVTLQIWPRFTHLSLLDFALQVVMGILVYRMARVILVQREPMQA